ncbi:hypothetical protein BJ986_002996 [Phycicoccus badiiscoriae]|uniref:HNH nuclease domain-containing protein n=1 Tax=Pedococcus badiiscoriae TaxID=642776 RepID=A0A852WIB5_9MICO|nr:DUF222 domain-containing protein [Pedococcus badiiscoriae]NYG08509.1 hypothetical protein [Pedococcus badiiscoriae]
MFESGHGSQAVEGLSTVVASLRTLEGGCDGERIDLITELEVLKAAVSAAQARLSVAFAESQEAAQAAAGVPARERGRGVAAQIALARRDSPHRGSRHLGFARAMVREMPHTLAHLTAGRVSEWRATILCRETAVLTVDDRREVDRRLAGDLPSMGDAQVARAARGLAAQLDPESVARRASKAAAERCVSLRPAPDTMTYLSGLLPVAAGVATYAALDRRARELIAGGDERGRGQIMADTLVERVTGQATAEAVPIEVNLVLPVDALLGTEDSTAELVGHGPIGAGAARTLLSAAAASGAPIWFRRLFAAGECQLVGLESRRRLFPEGLRRFLVLRDKVCRTPWCDAPVRHADHVVAAGRDGPTSAANGQGLCAACNQAKEARGWSAQVVSPGQTSQGLTQRHRVRLRTPTGHLYDSTAPPLFDGGGGDRAADGSRPDFSWAERALELRLAAA